jgi:hypothetical protein
MAVISIKHEMLCEAIDTTLTGIEVRLYSDIILYYYTIMNFSSEQLGSVDYLCAAQTP